MCLVDALELDIRPCPSPLKSSAGRINAALIERPARVQEAPPSGVPTMSYLAATVTVVALAIGADVYAHSIGIVLEEQPKLLTLVGLGLALSGLLLLRCLQSGASAPEGEHNDEMTSTRSPSPTIPSPPSSSPGAWSPSGATTSGKFTRKSLQTAATTPIPKPKPSPMATPTSTLKSPRHASSWAGSAVYTAAETGDHSALRVLLQQWRDKADVLNHDVGDGLTPLMVASRNGRTDCVRLLVACPCVCVRVNSTCADGNSALHLAAGNDMADVAEALLRTPGVNVNLLNGAGESALHLAEVRGHESLARRLRAATAGGRSP